MSLQKETWSSKFGEEYTDRNIFSPDELDELYINEYGITRTGMNQDFLNNVLDKDAKILEVGCNVGNQLRLLKKMGYNNLYGIELQDYAVGKAKELTKGINIIQGVGDNIPFKDEYFDLVFTSGVLIHIPPTIIKEVLKEIYRCSKKYIWGFEYYSDKYEDVNYRENSNLLWKGNFVEMYLEQLNKLEVVKEKRFKYINSENFDSMYLLKK